jgi:hypothetical protein
LWPFGARPVTVIAAVGSASSAEDLVRQAARPEDRIVLAVDGALLFAMRDYRAALHRKKRA